MKPATERLHARAERLDAVPLATVVQYLHQEDLRAVRAAGEQLRAVARLAQAVQRALAAGGRLIYLGAGTSGRLGALDAAECEPTFGARRGQVVALVAGGRRALAQAVEGAEDDARAGAKALRALTPGPRDVVCGISASARTPFVLGALAAARAAGATTALVTCDPASRTRVDLPVRLNTGPELVAGSTRLKAATATKLVLNAVSTAAFIGLGRVYRGRMIDARARNAKLRARSQAMVAELTGRTPAEAGRLLRKAGGSARTALAMHFTGLPAAAAAQLAATRGLRALQPRRQTR